MSYTIKQIDGSTIQEKYHVNSLLAKVIANSNLSDDKIKELLDTDITLSTSKAKCVLDCCERIKKAVTNHEKVFVAGDYDTDGICSTALMKDILDKLGIQNGYYIPNRFKEGYGLSANTVEAVYQKGYTLIITVDNGVKAKEAIKRAHELNIDIIVTDHHEINEPVDTEIVVHPDYMEEEYQYLSGAGVVLEISRNLFGENDIHTSLATIALIGDVMPLWKETRKIVKKGFACIQNNALPAISSLIRKGSTIDEVTIGFQVVPKLNSVARMQENANVNTLVPFLLNHNPYTIANFATQLNAINEKRKTLSSKMCDQATDMIEEDDFIILYDDSFLEGLAGLVAGRIANTYQKPCIIFARNEDTLKGSGRSIPGFDLFTFMQEVHDNYISFGGHEQAVGLSIKANELETFKEKVKTLYKEKNIVVSKKESVAIQLDEKDIDVEAIQSLDSLKPIPKEMDRIIFAIEDPTIAKITKYEKVTKYELHIKNKKIDGVLFSYQKLNALEDPSILVGALSINAFRAMKNPQMLIEYMEN